MLEELLRRLNDGDEGRRRLFELLLRQEVVANETLIAEGLIASHELVAFGPGQVLMEQDAADSDIYFVLIGEVSIEVHGRELAVRAAGQHVGEMTLIDPSARRSATVRAKVDTIAARVTEDAFSSLAGAHPVMWRRLALELGHRLRQRGSHVHPRNERPEVFIGSCSSDEGLALARAIQTAHAHDPWLTRIWTDGTFGAGATPIESLVTQLDSLDFALLVVTPDDLVDVGAGGQPSPRDNVIFELGLMMGALGRDRVFMVKTRCRPEDLRLPSDLNSSLSTSPDILASSVSPITLQSFGLALTRDYGGASGGGGGSMGTPALASSYSTTFLAPRAASTDRCA